MGVNNGDYNDIWGSPGANPNQRTGANAGMPTIYTRLNSGCDLCVKITLSYPMLAGGPTAHIFPFVDDATGERPFRPTRSTITVYPDGSGTAFQTRWWGNPRA